MSNSRKSRKYDPRKDDLFFGLGVEYHSDIHMEAIGSVMEVLMQMRDELYSSSKQMRAHLYFDLIRQTLELMEIDGGPTFGLELCRRAMEELEAQENERGKKVIGPFLTKAERKALRRDYNLRIDVPWCPKWGMRIKKLAGR